MYFIVVLYLYIRVYDKTFEIKIVNEMYIVSQKYCVH